MRLRLAATAAVILLGAGVAVAADAPPQSATPKPAPPPPAADTGYLQPGQLDTLQVIPPSPPQGSPRANADTSIFLATRSFEGSDRWKLAQNDDNSAGILGDMSCAVGVVLDAKTAPRLAAILLKVRHDVSLAVNQTKDIYKRPRPYLIADGPTCLAKTDSLAKSPDYPSGHNTWGWTTGLILAELAPDRATQVLVRGRAFGESRLVCGVHSLSAVQAGRDTASSLVATLHGSPKFRADMEAARWELTKLRKTGKKPDAAVCAAEAALTSKTPY